MKEPRGTRRAAKSEAEQDEEQKQPEEVSVPVDKPDRFGEHREWVRVQPDAAQEWDERLWTRRRVWPG